MVKREQVESFRKAWGLSETDPVASISSRRSLRRRWRPVCFPLVSGNTEFGRSFSKFIGKKYSALDYYPGCEASIVGKGIQNKMQLGLKGGSI